MHIEKIIGHIVEVKIGFQYAMGNLEAAQSIIWEIVAGRFRGYGEGAWSGKVSNSPAHYRTLKDGMASTITAHGDTRGILSAAEKKLIESMTRPLVGEDPLRREALLPDLPATFNASAWMVREGLSIALNDLAGKISGVPVHTLLGGKRRDQAPGMPVIHVGPPEVMARRAKKWAAAGYRFIKVKLRGNRQEDLVALKAIRQVVGQRIRIQVDANDGYTRLAEALAATRDLQRLGIELFEDILDAPLAQIAVLRKKSGVRIMVDKQSYWPNVREVVKCGAADVINHHPNLRGGLDLALKIDAVASAWGIPTAVGSSGVFGIQDAAFQSLGAVVGLSRPCEDIGLQPYYSGPTRGEYDFDRDPDLLRRPYPIVRGMIQIPDRPGLGVEPDPRKLARATLGGFCIA
jgi:L-alanine-DL-glutamate epimerase-like enolase superfamily enzyme